jgi:uncharacterized membrane protein YphA (DoxX/SURF4 family)
VVRHRLDAAADRAVGAHQPGARSARRPQLVAPNWELFALGQAVAETAVGVLLIVGLATRPAAIVATLLAINLSLTVAFLDHDVGIRWLYYLPVLIGIEVAVNGAGSLALERSRVVPSWLSS